MAKVYIVVAESSRAKIYQSNLHLEDMIEVDDLTHPESRQHERDLTSDLPGRGASSGAGSHHGIDDKTHAKQEEFASFAKYIDDYLARALEQNKFEKLAIIAAPALLGAIRKKIQPNVADKIIYELDKNLLHCDARQLRDHLPDKL